MNAPGCIGLCCWIAISDNPHNRPHLLSRPETGRGIDEGGRWKGKVWNGNCRQLDFGSYPFFTSPILSYRWLFNENSITCYNPEHSGWTRNLLMPSPTGPDAGNRHFDCILITLVAPDLIILQSDSPASRAAPVRSAANSPGRRLHFTFFGVRYFVLLNGLCLSGKGLYFNFTCLLSCLP